MPFTNVKQAVEAVFAQMKSKDIEGLLPEIVTQVDNVAEGGAKPEDAIQRVNMILQEESLHNEVLSMRITDALRLWKQTPNGESLPFWIKSQVLKDFYQYLGAACASSAPGDAFGRFSGIARASSSADAGTRVDEDAQEIDVQTIFRHAKEDLVFVLMRSQELTEGGTKSALYWSNSKSIIQEWITHPESAMIIIQGCTFHENAKRIASTSLLCVSLRAALIRGDESAVVVQFFCGLHNRPGDLWEGPKGLLASLSLQLARQLEKKGLLDLAFLQNEDIHKIPEYLRTELNFETFVFGELLKLFKTGSTVYCLMDGIANFRPEDDAALSRIMHIAEIFCDRREGPVFKLLVTVPGYCDSIIMRHFQTDCRMKQTDEKRYWDLTLFE